MDQMPIKLCDIVTGNNKELRKIQISWTFRISSRYYYKLAQDTCDLVYSQREKAQAQSSHGSTTEHTLTYLEQTSLSNSQFVLDLPTAAKPPPTKSILQYWNSSVFVGSVSPKP